MWTVPWISSDASAIAWQSSEEKFCSKASFNVMYSTESSISGGYEDVVKSYFTLKI